MWSTGGLLGLIFGGPVPLASQNLYPIIVAIPTQPLSVYASTYFSLLVIL